MPDLFSVHPHTGAGPEGLPDADTPYYVIAKDGLFLHKKTQIGSVLVKEATIPKHINLGTIGFEHGLFTWEGNKIPAHIISQAIDFFRRTYTKHHAEAEVLLTMHNETKAIRIFVPYQRVSGGGVKSVFEPTHIDPAYTVIGTIHSHCMMPAFHSGTDSNDASDMDGVHLTMGMVMNNPPQVVAMVAMNGQEFHYKEPKQIAEIVWDADTAPLWWDQFIFPADTATQKPKGLKTITQQQWDEFRGLAQPKPKIVKHDFNSFTQSHHGYHPKPVRGSEDNEWSAMDYVNRLLAQDKRSHITKESEEFNRRRTKALTVWTPEGAPNTFHQTFESMAIDLAIDHAIAQNLLVASDWTKIDALEMDSLPFWQQFFQDRLDVVSEVLELLGINITYSAKADS